MIIKKDVFNLLQDWYLAQCNGDWEHEFGVKIDTLDNPGWSVTIDLIGTNCENKKFNSVDKQINEHHWIQCNIINSKFYGTCGPQNLTDLVEIFIEWQADK